MNESILLKLAIIFSIIGLIVLFIFTSNIEKTSVKKLFLEEETVEVSGIVKGIKKTADAAFIQLETKKMENVIVFSNVSLNEGDNILVEGKRDGNIIAERIEKI